MSPEAPTTEHGAGGSDLGSAIRRAADVLAAAPAVALACHVNPDPDAIGSMLGLAMALAAGGTEVVCSWPNDPLEHPRWLDTLDPDTIPPIVKPGAFPKAPQVMVALDTASSDRLAALEPNGRNAGCLIVLDHHATNPGFGSITVLDPTASSTAEIAYRLIQTMGLGLPDHAAACLYAGLVTDTGRFQYAAVTPETLRVGAALRGSRFDHAKLAQYLFEDNSLPYLKVMAMALDRLAFVPEVRLVWTYLDQADLASTPVTLQDTDDLIDVIRTAREAEVASVIKQQRDGRFKVSLRSRGSADVAALAQKFGGGGHRLAAGYTSKIALQPTVDALVEALSRGADDGA
jgi:phosphoesterase RecJ-like protein